MSTLEETQEEYAKITPREMQIVTLMADGLNNLEIAAELGIKKSTVDVHKYNILKKTGCKNAPHVVATFLRCQAIA